MHHKSIDSRMPISRNAPSATRPRTGSIQGKRDVESGVPDAEAGSLSSEQRRTYESEMARRPSGPLDRRLPFPQAERATRSNEGRCILTRQFDDPGIAGDAGLVEQRLPRRIADEFAVGEGIGDEVAGGRFVGQQPRRPPRTAARATASNTTEGPPSIFSSASIQEPSLASTPPTIGATSLSDRAFLLERRPSRPAAARHRHRR